MSEEEESFAPAGPAVLKQEVAERLAAHRSRRSSRVTGEHGVSAVETEAEEVAIAGARTTRIAAAVAERYAQAQSYRAFLAAEAEKAIRQAGAAAEAAARNAETVAAAQQKLLEELAAAAEESSAHAAEVLGDMRPAGLLADEAVTWPLARVSTPGLRVRLYEDVGRMPRESSSEAMRSAEPRMESESEETRALDEEIAFRQWPTFELDRPSVGIPGNLLEFPRLLVAARKARPRYAEGPLREDGDAGGTGQMRIFEVEAEQITSAPVVESAAPEWSSIWLDALAKSVPEEAGDAAQLSMLIRLEAAPIERRVMASVVDGAVLLAAFLSFVTAVAWIVPELPSVSLALVGIAGGVFGALFLIYRMLFFTLAEATPGMRYARLGLCTFGDENPTRRAMRRRTWAVLLAACPLGLGFLWACLDDDRLGWHDRISRMYARGY